MRFFVVLGFLLLLTSCFNADVANDDDKVEETVASSITYNLYPGPTSIRFHDSGYVAIAKEPYETVTEFTFETYDLDANLLLRKEIPIDFNGDLRFIDIDTDGSSWVSVVDKKVLKIDTLDGGIFKYHYETKCHIFKLSMTGDVIWRDTITSNDYSPRNILTGNDDSYLLGTYQKFACLTRLSDSVSKEFKLSDTGYVYPIVGGAHNVFSLWGGDEKNSLLCYNANGDTVWHQYNEESNILNPSLYAGDDRVFVVYYKDQSTSIKILNVLSGEYIGEASLGTISENYPTSFKKINDTEILVLGSTWDYTINQTGHCVVHRYSLNGELIKRYEPGTSETLYSLYDALYLGKGNYLFSAQVRLNGVNKHVVFKSNLDDIHYLDSIDVSDSSLFNSRGNGTDYIQPELLDIWNMIEK